MSSSKRPEEDWISYRKRLLDPVSPSFCAAKWLDATIWLGHGGTASCHLPPAHRIDTDEVLLSPAALHNTTQKKKMRNLMLDGHRPTECDYCWKIEDIKRDNMSDRMFKSAQYGEGAIQAVASAPWDADVVPETLEIAFNRTCNFACSYCNAGFSTSWAKDIQTHGAYQNMISDGAGAFQHDGAWAEPYGKLNEGNPYIAAFWQWWPELSKGLRRLRVTGGEPLMSTDVWKLLDYFSEHKPPIILAINSNLGAKKDLMDRLIARSRDVDKLEIYTSNEAMGEQAEYIRDGMVWSEWTANVERLLTEGSLESLHMMLTINGLCLFSLPSFLDQMVEWKRRFGARRPGWSVNILRFPSFMSPLVLPDNIRHERRDALIEWIGRNEGHPLISDYEFQHLRRLVDYLDTVDTPHAGADDMDKLRRDLKTFHRQYDQRRGKSVGVFPDNLVEWLKAIPDTDLGFKQVLISGSAI
jgi:organic radical activating enzyme